MVIQHNMLADFTNRQLDINNKSISKNTEKLASGYRVNKSADDAASLSISEKMRGQIRGLHRASQNAQDGISLLNVADGGLHEIQSILQRIRELSVQSANDTNVKEDRDAIQREIVQLNHEVDRIGKSTEFNTIKVLQGYDVEIITKKGTAVIYSNHQGVVDVMGKGGTVQCGKHYLFGKGDYTLTNGNVISDDPLKDSEGIAHYSYQLDFSVVDSVAKWDSLDSSGFTFVCSLGCKQEFTFKFDKTGKGIKDETPNANIINGGIENNKVFTVGTSGYSKGEDFVNELLDFISKIGTNNGGSMHVGHDNLIGTSNGSDLIVYGTCQGRAEDGYLIIGKPEITEVEIPVGKNVLNGKVLNIQAGANTGQLIGLILPHIDSEELEMDRIIVTSSKDATTSIGYVDEMIETVSMERSKIGAYTNRLEHTYANADNMAENLQASESLIRDANLADEMLQYSSRNIIQQAAQSVLAQSNSMPEGILALIN